MNYKEIVAKMSVSQKAKLLSGTNSWKTNAFDSLGIPSIFMTDGPYGLRKIKGIKKHIGLSNVIPATCFPPSCTLAASFDCDLAKNIGKAIGEECQQENVNIILGPGVNIKRNPLCGRNFEYYSEDPFLSGKLGASWICGVQSEGVGCSIKHYCCNNQEDYRYTSESVVDERALREIYLKPFEIAIKEGKPLCLMTSYNSIYGHPLTESKKMLTKVVREEWGFKGLIMSDWGACTNRPASLEAGLDLEMPGDCTYNLDSLISAVNNKKVSEETLNKSCTRVLMMIDWLKASEKKSFHYDVSAHHKLAVRAAEESAVLLKNNNVLPIARGEKICLIGRFAKFPRYEGSGSSRINPTKLSVPFDAFKECGDYPYADGYNIFDNEIDIKEEKEALTVAINADKILFFGGLTTSIESEGYDRKDMKLPANQLSLLKQICKLNKKVIVVLFNGSPVEMPFINSVDAILEMYLPGQGGGTACAHLIFGDKVPCGKLPETFPVSVDDCMSSSYFPEGPYSVEYRESIYVGYRFFDKAGIAPLFPFGFGLSYTTFGYSALSIEKTKLGYQIKCRIKNTGNVAGTEICQLYIGHNDTDVFKAVKELKGFVKVPLDFGEEKEVSFNLSENDFAYYNIELKKWVIESGKYTILIGKSSADIALSGSVDITNSKKIFSPYSCSLLPDYYSPSLKRISDKEFIQLYGNKLPLKSHPSLPLSQNSSFSDFKQKFFGRIIYRVLWFFFTRPVKKAHALSDSNPSKEYEESASAFIRQMAVSQPLKTLWSSSSGALSYNQAEGLIRIANGKLFSGLLFFFKRK